MSAALRVVEAALTHAAQCWVTDWFERRKAVRQAELERSSTTKDEAPVPYAVPADIALATPQ